MGKKLIAGLVLGLGGLIGGVAQSATPSAAALELRLAPENIQNEIPQAFTFLLTNRSDHDVRVPSPSIQCGDTMDGVIWLRLRLVPLKAGSSGSGGTGCASSAHKWPTILERAKQWKVLRPGESLRLQADRERLSYDGKEAGTYKLWAEYTPPFVSTEDRAILVAAGIDYPPDKLRSADLTYWVKP